ncbi:hypothetical protein Salat_1226000 [Sesamum alatum]|uniref:CCHC-type domain-containing protein n=1 Tax=Sesamum alatum TaxID=300844 RepID=A0AAE2CP36_9LAMI|nr:hypothetical protein Salat_1226000 [Sesamum alatum]
MEVVNGESANTQYGVEKLVGTNYKYWRMCMEAYLQGQDLWEPVVGDDTEIPANAFENAEPRRKWKIKRGKAFFALRTSISREFIGHVCDVNSPKQKEYSPYGTSVQGWEKQPLVEELESLLSNQEALAKQMAKSFNFDQDAVLFSRGKLDDSDRDTDDKKVLNHNPQSNRFIKCYRCGKPGHIKRNYRTRLSRANVACEDNDGDEWIIDSGCSHHVTGDDTLFSKLRQHNEKRVIVTTDNSTYPVAKEGSVKIDADETSVKLDDVYHVLGLKKNLISVSQITQQHSAD